jgi:hypothetical protein
MKLTAAIRNAQNDIPGAALNDGYFRGYAGTKPTNADTALSGNTLLFEGRFAADAFPSSSAGSATANTMTNDASANASGTLSFVRCLEDDGTTVVADVTVGVGSGEFQVNDLAIVSGVPVTITSFAISTPLGS